MFSSSWLLLSTIRLSNVLLTTTMAQCSRINEANGISFISVNSWTKDASRSFSPRHQICLVTLFDFIGWKIKPRTRRNISTDSKRKLSSTFRVFRTWLWLRNFILFLCCNIFRLFRSFLSPLFVRTRMI